MDSIASPADGDEALASATSRVTGDTTVLKIVSISCRSMLASCSGGITKWSLSSGVNAQTLETVAAAVGAAAGAAPAGVERVVGPAVAAAAGAEGNTDTGAIGEGASIVQGMYRLEQRA
eukprot:3874940-Pleurochrysis_carterae.AAC.2